MAVFFLLVASARADHGLAMHGTPKYLAGFAHFDYVNPEAPKGGALRQAVVGSFDSLNPFIVRGQPALGLAETHEALLARSWDEPFTLYGLLAEDVTTAEDRTWVEFRLRPQARWHDGRPVTPDDVLFTWETLRRQGRPHHRAYYNRVRQAARAGERGIRFTFQPDADGVVDRELPLILGLMPILSRDWWQNRRFDETFLTPFLGSGPYRVDMVEPGRAITYRRVADYWGQALPVRRGLHNFDTVRYDYYRDDGVALEAFKAGDANLRREHDAPRWAVAYDFPAASDGRVRLERLPHQRPEPMRGLIFNTRRPPFDDPRVREALSLALDFPWMNRALFRGMFRRTDSFYPNSELAATGRPGPGETALLAPFRRQLPPELFTTPYAPPTTDGSGPPGLRANLRAAQRLLAEAGWKLLDGRLEDEDGNHFAFEILLALPAEEKIALEYARALARLGILARVRTVDSAQYQARLDDFDFDMILHRWISTLSPGNEQMVFFGSAAADQPGSRNYPGIRQAAVDALASSLGQTRERADLVTRVRALDRVLLWGRYVIPLGYVGADLLAAWCPLRHPEIQPLYGTQIESWWYDPSGCPAAHR